MLRPEEEGGPLGSEEVPGMRPPDGIQGCREEPMEDWPRWGSACESWGLGCCPQSLPEGSCAGQS